ncbi:MAG TPA: aminotransferase class III-fold pyridoxal phosphate-dependent enzyme [Kofleriaceae bacterium]|jgi:taurine--2-oxoglutarate transaminase
MSEWPFFFTWTAQNTAKPLEITGGQGAHFTTSDGASWLDLGSLSYQVNAGHGRQRIVDAIVKQANQLCISAPNAVYPAKVELAQRLLALAGPGYTKVFFTLGGAEANENAIKIARQVTGRYKMISRYRSYHGASMGALALTGDWRRAPMEPLIPGVTHVHDCDCERCANGNRNGNICDRGFGHVFAQTMASEGAKTTAAVFLEPVPGANGAWVPPPDYWPAVRAACHADGALLVADEVLCGFGRTGKAFGFQHWNVVPDMITVAKGLASGYATIGAVIVHERVAAHFDANVLACGLTYYAHPTACAAALETLKLYEDEASFANSEKLGHVLLRELDAVAARLAVKAPVRGLGLLAAIAPEAPLETWSVLSSELTKRKLSLHVEAKRGTAIFAPPLCITEEELVTGIRAFGDAAVIAFGGKQ